MRGWLLWLVALVLVGACVPELPSPNPLGRGPRAEPELEETVVSRRPSARPDAGADEDDLADATAGQEAAPPAAAAGGAADAGPPEAADGGEPTDAETSPVLTKRHVFAGDYSGSDTTTIRLDGLPEQSHPDPRARIEIERVSDDEVRVVIIDSNTGDPFCTLLGKVKANVATLEPGQTCPEQAAEGTLSGTVTSGTVTVTGRRLVIDLEADIEVEAGGARRSGTLVYHFEGWRKLD